ncbi:exodeoxyribonuclease VII large subunit [Candidatus Saccharibacteria bacterium]|nr:exodeoxyribonuclease VII large subunit [Candidatus Saccharibacteria bacterium]
MEELVFTPTDFVAVFNQTLELAYPVVTIEGELANFHVSRGRWVYFGIKDELASIKFFGSVYQLPGPLQDGLKLRVIGTPRLHPQFGFSITFQSIQPVGEGAIKKAADLLRVKLEAEGLFAPQRKRPLPEIPRSIGLITAANSAACADFIKILNERWGGVEIILADVLVQGMEAPEAIVGALDHFEQISPLVDVLVITRGGGSAEDLVAFNDERVVRAVAGSRTPTLVAIGHEVDISLAELAADRRASTPTNAAQIVVPDRQHVIAQLDSVGSGLQKFLMDTIGTIQTDLAGERKYLTSQVFSSFDQAKHNTEASRKLIKVFDPRAALKRGYAIISKGREHVRSVRQVAKGDNLGVEMSDGKINVTATTIHEV